MLSVGGAPSFGIFCTKSVIQEADVHAASSRCPSSLMVVFCNRTARTCFTGGAWAASGAAMTSRRVSGQRRTGDLTVSGMWRVLDTMTRLGVIQLQRRPEV